MRKRILTQELESQIENLRIGITNTRIFYIEALSLCKKALLYQKQVVSLEGFSTEQHEIEFFKVTKQNPLHLLVYYTELRFFENKYPLGAKKKQEKYINKQLDRLNRFFEYHLDFIQYVESGSEYLDKQYFLRKNLDFSRIPYLKFYNLDPEFNTSHDLLLAKLFAYRKLADLLMTRLNEVQNTIFKEIPKSQLKWTSSKAALTELTYALYHGGAVNNGNTDIKEIASALERTFNFPIGDLYRTYTEIRSRKKGQSKFLDELSVSLITGMSRLDE